MKTNEVGRE